MTPRALRVMSRTLAWLGAVALVYAAGTVGFAAMYQRDQARRFDDRVIAGAPLAATALHDGDVVGRLRITRIGLSVMVLHGVAPATLALGAGHVPGTPLPGVGGNVSLAAHRDTYFRGLRTIAVGDRIEIATLRGTFVYAVDGTEVVDPDDTRVVESRGRSELTLITCYPFDFVGAAPRRFIVHARQIQ